MLTVAIKVVESHLSNMLNIGSSNHNKFLVRFIQGAKVLHLRVSPAVSCPIFEIKVHKTGIGAVSEFIY